MECRWRAAMEAKSYCWCCLIGETSYYKGRGREGWQTGTFLLVAWNDTIINKSWCFICLKQNVKTVKQNSPNTTILDFHEGDENFPFLMRLSNFWNIQFILIFRLCPCVLLIFSLGKRNYHSCWKHLNLKETAVNLKNVSSFCCCPYWLFNWSRW